MIANQRAANLLIVGDTPHFGRVVAAILGNGGLSAARQRHTTYEGFRGMLSPRLLADTDLFVLELWRTYPTGLRAEGLAVAEELIRQRARPLVVSPLALGTSEVACRGIGILGRRIRWRRGVRDCCEELRSSGCMPMGNLVG